MKFGGFRERRILYGRQKYNDARFSVATVSCSFVFWHEDNQFHANRICACFGTFEYCRASAMLYSAHIKWLIPLCVRSSFCGQLAVKSEANFHILTSHRCNSFHNCLKTILYYFLIIFHHRKLIKLTKLKR